MAISKGISKTLKTKLFTSPSPYKVEQYKKLKRTIFPCEKDFISFLEERNTQNRVALAKKILRRLSYEMKFSIPDSFITNVLDMEEVKKAETKVGYASRDHFLHLVHLYLLGIYFFFYHKILHNSVLSFFVSLKKENSKLYKSKSSPVEDFISTWKLFVLGHDLGYPIENYSQSKSSVWKQYALYYKDFSSIFFYDLSMKILARSFSARHALCADASYLEFTSRDSDLVNIYDHKGDQSNCIDVDEKRLLIEKLDGSIRLPRVTGAYTIKALMSFLKDKDLVYVLEDGGTGKIYAIVACVGKSDSLKSYVTDNSIGKRGLLASNLKYLAQAGEAPSGVRNASWHCYCQSPDELFDEFVEKHFGDNKSKSFNEIADAYCSDLPRPLRSVVTDEHFKVLGCYLFWKLNREISQFVIDYSPDKTEAKSRIIDKELSRLNKIFMEVAGALFTESVSKSLPSDLIDVENKTVKNIVDEYIEYVYFDFNKLSAALNNAKSSISKLKKMKSPVERDRLSSLFSAFEDLKEISVLVGRKKKQVDRLSSAITDGIDFDLSQHIRQKMGLYNIWEDIINKTFNNTKDSLDVYGECCESYTQKNFGSISSGIVDRFLSSIGIDSVGHLFSYNPRKLRTYYDHGVASAMILGSFQSVYSKLLKDVEAEDDLIRMGIGIGLKYDLDHFKYKLDVLSDVAKSAILVHNISFDKFSGFEGNRVRLSKNPFVFLSVLADYLQDWDRPRSMNQAHMELGNETYSPDYDIAVEKDYFRITHNNVSDSINDRYEKLKYDIDNILADASGFFRFNLAEKDY